LSYISLSFNTKWWCEIICNGNLKIFHTHFLIWYLSPLSPVNCTWVSLTSVSDLCIGSTVDCHVVWWWITGINIKDYAKSLSLVWDALFGALNHISLTTAWKLILNHFLHIFSPLILLLFRHFTCFDLVVTITENWTDSSSREFKKKLIEFIVIDTWIVSSVHTQCVVWCVARDWYLQKRTIPKPVRYNRMTSWNGRSYVLQWMCLC
jgi:hypothetical protein